MISGVTATVTWMLLGAIGALAAMYWWGQWKKKRGRASGWLTMLRLRRELKRLTHDPDVADRLLSRERERHPELSEAAILEKVIRRLTRDRGR